ncbi:dienelactone hydrolase family protein [Christensenellaceae bacterium NSJ-44]|uniref:Dienelactone hydrolase family protein n=1 Tax=Luoshenia tenuis TaxID=2763654 RepID=A0A926CZW0_9FIRM|nr:alpha/beta hydrolase family protein [Luoshenia tenuis]MBC8529178.1 dienelactone hydrolase family protein [Luoshenia tenuis]
MMDLEMDRYFETCYERRPHPFAMPLGNKAHWISWRADFIRTLVGDLRGFPQQYGPLESQTHDEAQRDGYRQILVSYSGEDGMRIPAYLLVPDSAQEQMPAVVCVAGHGAGMTEIAGLTPEGEMRAIGEGYQKDFAVALCKRGFVVLVPEMLGFGLRRLKADIEKGPDECSCYRMSTNLLMMGKTMAGLRARDVMRSLDYLETLPFVDAARIGSMGISGGGTTLMYAAAIDGRLRANVISCSGCTFRHSILSVYHCIDNFVPDLYTRGEMYDILGLLAPRPLMLEAGRQDDLFPLEGVQTCFDQLTRAYSLLGARDKLDIDIFDAGHSISGAKSYDFLGKWLRVDE